MAKSKQSKVIEEKATFLMRFLSLFVIVLTMLSDIAKTIYNTVVRQ